MAVDGVAAYERCGFDVPAIVQAALRRAREMRFANACLPEQGRLLEVLARGRAGGRIGETGTGCDVGLAWLASASDPATTLMSVERDPVLAAAADDLFQDWPNVRVLHGDWTAIADWAPFDLLVLDAGAKLDPARLDPVDLLAPGAGLVIDDFSPTDAWPPHFRRRSRCRAASLVGAPVAADDRDPPDRFGIRAGGHTKVASGALTASPRPRSMVIHSAFSASRQLPLGLVPDPDANGGDVHRMAGVDLQHRAAQAERVNPSIQGGS